MKRSRIKPKAKRHPMPPGRYDEVIERDRWCQASKHGLTTRCDGPPEVNHIRNRGMGGSADPSIHDLDNLMLLCRGHHHWVTNHPKEAKELGLSR